MKAVISVAVKGGVGKTLVAANLALELSKHGSVGTLDADLDSPNIYEVFGLSERLELTEDRRIIPIEHQGLKIFSMGGFLANNGRGLSLSGQSMRQLIEDAVKVTEWGDLDYLVVDAPAGTSADKFLAIRDALKDDLVGAVVTTQPNIREDVRRLVDLCSRHRIRIIGLIENMSGLVCRRGHQVRCSVCGEEVNPFGSGGREVAQEHGLEFLGGIPLSPEIRHGLETGNPQLPEAYKEPIQRAVEKIISAKMSKKGIIRKILEALK